MVQPDGPWHRIYRRSSGGSSKAAKQAESELEGGTPGVVKGGIKQFRGKTGCVRVQNRYQNIALYSSRGHAEKDRLGRSRWSYIARGQGPVRSYSSG
jgi:hypothetical protein